MTFRFGSFGQAIASRNLPTKNTNCLWRPCLLTYWDKMRNRYRGLSIDTSLHLAKRFQRRRLRCEKLTYDGRQAMSKAHISFGKVTKKRVSTKDNTEQKTEVLL